MIQKLILFIGFSLSTAMVFSQNITLKGKLADSDDKTVIIGATIKLALQKDSTQSRMVITDKIGNFAFNNLNQGQYVLTITHIGYGKIEQRVNIQASNEIGRAHV